MSCPGRVAAAGWRRPRFGSLPPRRRRRVTTISVLINVYIFPWVGAKLFMNFFLLLRKFYIFFIHVVNAVEWWLDTPLVATRRVEIRVLFGTSVQFGCTTVPRFWTISTSERPFFESSGFVKNVEKNYRKIPTRYRCTIRGRSCRQLYFKTQAQCLFMQC